MKIFKKLKSKSEQKNPKNNKKANNCDFNGIREE